MSSDHENPAGLSDRAPTADYDGFAEAYAAETESSLLNGYYARPAIWAAPLAELRRVLVRGGRLIVAVNHPYVYKAFNPDRDYFSTHEYGVESDFNGQSVLLSQWHRPMPALIAAFVEAGFRIAVLSEPPPAPGAHERFPDEVKTPDSAFLCFLFLVLEAE
ncbi:hypothetical protein [Glycomyces algeriensis]|uniref:Methyltransferase n=1 Tax=Glycomyces algeriensis TaxID=256037 RepID=A0A9W6LI28_9ACTN|nr:hypothetical protein [Glycomyces algeriensis]MDA1365778.1 hypothetical protein [Glycomyces algeriensis]MDR7351467.1 hypothetical protein [Glycomyces algeriensis]GLI44188.1 hypothetical protein GALLR39Z86_40380 [Glycomyces algeriensis]